MSLWNESLQTIEQRLARLEKRQETLYHRGYARIVRRQRAEQRALEQAKAWVKKFKDLPGVPMQRIGRILSQVDQGKIIVALDRREYHQLQRLLARVRTLPSRRRPA